MRMRLGVILVCLAALSPAARAGPSTRPWTPLFNGKDFTGWYPHLTGGKPGDAAHVFTIEDGAIHLYKNATEGSDQPIGFLSTNEAFGDCRIRLEYKWGTKRFGSYANAKRDAGLLYFATGADGAFTAGRPWPTCVEFQIQENDVGDVFAVGTQLTTTIDPAKKGEKKPYFKEGGEPYTTPPTGNNRVHRDAMLEKDGWNSVELILDGDTATHVVNGKVALRATALKAPVAGGLILVRKGRILLQAEGAEVWYRNVEVQSLR